MKQKLSVQTVKCVDRQMWVREIINQDGDCVAELSAENSLAAVKHRACESLFTAAPDMLEALEYVANGDGDPNETASMVLAAIRKAKGEL